MTSQQSRDWRSIGIKIGASLFIISIPAVIVGSVVFGKAGVAWSTVLIVYPSLMMIGAAVGVGDLVQAFDALRTGNLFKNGAFPPVFLIGRGFVFSGLVLVFLFMEIRAVSSLSNL